MENTVEVSIICNAYNHEKYIREALESFLMQKTYFEFEVLVHDDASTDKTADIIREYEIKYPEIIKPIYQTVNQYSQKIDPTDTFQIPRVKGKYIAVCEGDDYWTDSYKLQKQYDALEAHPEIDMCAHKAKMVNGITGEQISYVQPKSTDTVISAEDVIGGGGGYVATNSLFYRARIADAYPPFYDYLRLDYTLQIYGSLRGGMLYLNDCMSAYRYMTPGSWTTSVSKNREKFKSHNEKIKNMLALLDKYTEYKYHDIIELRILTDEFINLRDNGMCKEAMGKKFIPVHRNISKKEMCKMKIKAYLPVVASIKRAFVRWRGKWQHHQEKR